MPRTRLVQVEVNQALTEYCAVIGVSARLLVLRLLHLCETEVAVQKQVEDGLARWTVDGNPTRATQQRRAVKGVAAEATQVAVRRQWREDQLQRKTATAEGRAKLRTQPFGRQFLADAVKWDGAPVEPGVVRVPLTWTDPGEPAPAAELEPAEDVEL